MEKKLIKVAFYTLGCKANQFESAALERLCRDAGHEIVPASGIADIYIINTCTVTGTAGKKSRAAIRQARKRNERAVIAVCGCFSQLCPEDAKDAGADLVFGTADRMKVIESAARMAACRLPDPDIFVREPGRDFEKLPAGGLLSRTRALLKVEDGCDNFCAYCIIPHARGRVRSMPALDAVREVRRLSEEGYRETVITGIEISSYGKDTGENLCDLIEQILRAAPDMRIRLGSLEPRTVTGDFCRRLAAYPNLCDHFHLSLQSGCDETLKRMRRNYDTALFLRSGQCLRTYFPDCAVTTDLIVGFPGETEEEFEKTLGFIQVCGFADMHIFPFSRRAGTPAATMAGQVSRAEKERRAARAAAVSGRMRAEFLSNLVGKECFVLLERRTGQNWQGFSTNYCPVTVCSGKYLKNQVIKAQVTRADEKMLYAEPVPSPQV